jgi:hypothetical protein
LSVKIPDGLCTPADGAKNQWLMNRNLDGLYFAESFLFRAIKVANSTLKSLTTIKAECGLARHAHEVANSDHAASRPEGRFGPTHCTAGMALDIAGDTGTGCRAGYNHALSSMQFC